MNLSIIIPAYNVELFLSRCVESIYNLNLKSFEILIINDGSTDNTLNVAKELSIKYDQIKVYTQDNKGLSYVRNLGIDRACGKYILFLDSDDFYNQCNFQELLIEMDNGNLDVLQFGYELKSNDYIQKISCLRETNIYSKEEFIANVFFTPFAVNKIIRRDFLLKLNLRFEEGRFMEDDYFSTELFLNCNRIGNNHTPIYSYYQNRASIRNKRNFSHEKKIIDDLVFSLNKHRSLFNYANRIMPNTNLNLLAVRYESIVFFMIVRMLRVRFSYEKINNYLDSVGFKKFYFFPKGYSSKKINRHFLIYWLLARIMNNRVVFKTVVFFNKKINNEFK